MSPGRGFPRLVPVSQTLEEIQTVRRGGVRLEDFRDAQGLELVPYRAARVEIQVQADAMAAALPFLLTK